MSLELLARIERLEAENAELRHDLNNATCAANILENQLTIIQETSSRLLESERRARGLIKSCDE